QLPRARYQPVRVVRGARRAPPYLLGGDGARGGERGGGAPLLRRGGRRLVQPVADQGLQRQRRIRPRADGPAVWRGGLLAPRATVRARPVHRTVAHARQPPQSRHPAPSRERPVDYLAIPDLNRYAGFREER